MESLQWDFLALGGTSVLLSIRVKVLSNRNQFMLFPRSDALSEYSALKHILTLNLFLVVVRGGSFVLYYLGPSLSYYTTAL